MVLLFLLFKIHSNIILWYNNHRDSSMCRLPPGFRGGDSVSVYEALSLMIAFGTLIAIIVLSR